MNWTAVTQPLKVQFLLLLLFVCHNKLNSRIVIAIACEQALRGALAAGREKEGELATTSLEFEFHFQFPCGSP